MITISKAKLKDCQKIRKLEQKVWEEQNITSPYDTAICVRYGYVFVAKEIDKIIGAIIAIKTRDNEIKIVDWIVDKKYKNKSIGLKLYKKLIQHVSNIPIIAFVNSKNKISINKHKKLGFKMIKKIKDPYVLGEKDYWFLMKRY